MKKHLVVEITLFVIVVLVLLFVGIAAPTIMAGRSDLASRVTVSGYEEDDVQILDASVRITGARWGSDNWDERRERLPHGLFDALVEWNIAVSNTCPDERGAFIVLEFLGTPGGRGLLGKVHSETVARDLRGGETNVITGKTWMRLDKVHDVIEIIVDQAVVLHI